MSLINCPECKNDISNYAINCPSCGYKLNRPKRGFLNTFFVLLFLGFNLIMLVIAAMSLQTIKEAVFFSPANPEEVAITLSMVRAAALLAAWVGGSAILGMAAVVTRKPPR